MFACNKTRFSPVKAHLFFKGWCHIFTTGNIHYKTRSIYFLSLLEFYQATVYYILALASTISAIYTCPVLLLFSPCLSIRQVHVPFKGCWVVFFSFIQILTEHSVSKQLVETDQMSHSTAADQGLHCLPMFHKKDPMLIWVKWYCPVVLSEVLR